MTNAELSLSSDELQVIYTILKEYEENTPEDDDGYNDYYDEYDEIIDKKQIKLILKKIGKNLPKEAKDEMDKDFLRKKYHTYNNDVNDRIYSALKKAFEQLRTVEIKYFNMDSAEFKTRKINIYYTSAKYTIGYCHLRKSIRKFRTSRIASAKLTDSKYRIPKSFDKNDY